MIGPSKISEESLFDSEEKDEILEKKVNDKLFIKKLYTTSTAISSPLVQLQNLTSAVSSALKADCSKFILFMDRDIDHSVNAT